MHPALLEAQQRGGAASVRGCPRCVGGRTRGGEVVGEVVVNMSSWLLVGY